MFFFLYVVPVVLVSYGNGIKVLSVGKIVFVIMDAVSVFFGNLFPRDDPQPWLIDDKLCLIERFKAVSSSPAEAWVSVDSGKYPVLGTDEDRGSNDFSVLQCLDDEILGVDFVLCSVRKINIKDFGAFIMGILYDFPRPFP